jgi:hypothetical protein
MKKTILFVAFLIATSFVHAQDMYNNDQIQTIFSKNRSNGFYGAFSLGYSQIDGKDALISGGRVAFIFDKSLGIGLGGYGFVNNLDYHTIFENKPLDYTLAGGYGGIFIEPIVGGIRPVHLSFPILIGIGGAALIEDYNVHNWDYYPPNDLDYDVFLVIEPAVELEFNLTRWFRTAASVSYRYTSKIDLYETDENVLRGLNFGMTFKFGKF